MYRFLFVCLGLLILTNVVSAFDIPNIPTGYVNDYANVLTLETKEELEKELVAFNASTTNEIAVVIVSDLGGVTVEEYAVKLFEKWKIGKAKEDNGVLLLVAVNDRVARIEVGYGLEGALPDILTKDILETKILAEFKKGSYNLGVSQGVGAIMEATKGEYKASGTSSSQNGVSIETIIFFGIVFFQFFVAMFARSKSWWAGGIFGGVLGGILTFLGIFGASLLVGSLITLLLVLLGLLFDYSISNGYSNAISRGGSIPWWVGGRGGSGGGSSFGGFGGGSSGGGGASGRW